MAPDVEGITALAAYTTLYTVQYLLGPTVGQLGARLAWPQPASEVFVRKFFGGLVLLIGTVVICLILPGSLAAYGLRLVPTLHDVTWTLGAGLPAFALVAGSAALGPDDPARPEIRLPRWSNELLITNAVAWTVYLLGYEAALRGMLLAATIGSLGVGAAVAVNMAIYVLIHLPKGARETLVSVPFGLLACAATIDTGSVWAPFLLHLMAAVTNDTIRARRFSQ